MYDVLPRAWYELFGRRLLPPSALVLLMLNAGCQSRPSDSTVEEQVLEVLQRTPNPLWEVDDFERVNGFEQDPNHYVVEFAYTLRFLQSWRQEGEDGKTVSKAVSKNVKSGSRDFDKAVHSVLDIGTSLVSMALINQYGHFQSKDEFRKKDSATFRKTEQGWKLASELADPLTSQFEVPLDNVFRIREEGRSRFTKQSSIDAFVKHYSAIYSHASWSRERVRSNDVAMMHRLPLADQERALELRAKLAAAARPVCAAYWRGQPDHDAKFDLHGAMEEHLTEDEVDDWLEFDAKASLAELDSNGPDQGSNAGNVGESLERFCGTLPEEECGAFREVMTAAMRHTRRDGCEAFLTLARGATSTKGPDHEVLTRHALGFTYSVLP
jgi:hypothetical protein